MRSAVLPFLFKIVSAPFIHLLLGRTKKRVWHKHLFWEYWTVPMIRVSKRLEELREKKIFSLIYFVCGGWGVGGALWSSWFVLSAMIIITFSWFFIYHLATSSGLPLFLFLLGFPGMIKFSNFCLLMKTEKCNCLLFRILTSFHCFTTSLRRLFLLFYCEEKKSFYVT